MAASESKCQRKGNGGEFGVEADGHEAVSEVYPQIFLVRCETLCERLCFSKGATMAQAVGEQAEILGQRSWVGYAWLRCFLLPGLPPLCRKPDGVAELQYPDGAVGVDEMALRKCVEGNHRASDGVAV
jgi:hypothetical protein